MDWLSKNGIILNSEEIICRINRYTHGTKTLCKEYKYLLL